MSDGIDGANGVTVINGTTGAYVGTVFTQLYGYGMAYDPVNQQVYMSASSDGGGYFIVAFSLVLQKQSTNTLVMIEMGLIVILIAVAPLIFLYVHRRIRARK